MIYYDINAQSWSKKLLDCGKLWQMHTLMQLEKCSRYGDKMLTFN